MFQVQFKKLGSQGLKKKKTQIPTIMKLKSKQISSF